MSRCCNICLVVGAVSGIVLTILIAVLGFKVLPDVVYEQIEDNVRLDYKTEQYERFVKLPFALNFTVYFFNIKNPEDVLKHHQKPMVEEVGPITYSKQHYKDSIQGVDHNKNIEYDQLKKHEFVRAYSSYPEDKTVTILNTPLVAVLQIFEKFKMDYLNKILKNGYKTAFALKEDSVFHTIQIKDYSFSGYKFCDPIKMAEASDEDFRAAKFICACIRLLAPESMEINEQRVISFSFFKQKNERSDGKYVVQRGFDDINQVGNIIRWRGKDQTSFWLPSTDDTEYHCNDVKGTDSTIYGPHNDKDSKFYIFNTDICRTVELTYESEIEYNDIPGYRSVFKQNNINWTLPENKCYCIKQTRPLHWNGDDDFECLPNGFTDMYSCLDAPIILSLPHFLWGDPEYANTIKGLTPDEEKHKIFVDMEPNTGSPLRGHKRVQFNLILREFFGLLDDASKPEFDIAPSLIPIVWIDEHVGIPEDLVDLIKDQYLTPVTAIEICKWVLLAIGIIMTVAFIGIFICRRRRSSVFV